MGIHGVCPPCLRQVTLASASVLLGGYLLFVLAVFGADLWHIVSGGLSKYAFFHDPEVLRGF